MTTTIDSRPRVPTDVRAEGALADTSGEVALVWAAVRELTGSEEAPMGLAAGDRPLADVEVLCSAVASLECELARRMHAAASAGALPLLGDGAIPRARGWSVGWSRRLARAGRLAAEHPDLEGVWAAGIITGEHVDGLARYADRVTHAEMAAVIGELAPLWGQLTPNAVAQFVERVIRMLYPPPDPQLDEYDAHEARSLSFAMTADSVHLAGSLPRVEGELVIAAIDAFAERLRSTADHVPAAARRADGLVALVNAAHAADALPSRGGLPVALSVTVQTTDLGDEVWSTSRGHLLTSAERRFATCDAHLTPVLIDAPLCGEDRASEDPPAAWASRPAARIAALARSLLGTTVPLAVGRTQRTATPAQRRALAVRDHGCVIPGCGIPAEACQTHHVRDWASGGVTDLDNLVLLCWAHHRQVDLGMWTVTATGPAGLTGLPAQPCAGAPPGTPWPANNGAPWIIVRTPRRRWRL